MTTTLPAVADGNDTPKKKGKRFYPKLADAGIAATEDTLSKHEGAIFDFRRKHATPSSETTATVKTKDGHELTIEWHPKFGRPNATAYLVLQALFFKSTQEGHPFPEAVSFTQRELLSLIGRTEVGGHNHDEIFDAINSLRWVELRGMFTDPKTDKNRILKLRIFGSAKFVRDAKSGAIEQAIVFWDGALRQRMNDDYWHVLPYDRIKGASAVEFAMYKQLFFRFSNIASHLVWQLKKSGQDTPDNIKKALAGITYTKDKDDFFQEYLGQLKPPKTISEFIRQFGDRLDDLKTRGLAGNWKIEKNADGDGHNLSFKPAQPFVQDWVAMNDTRRQPRLKYAEATDQANIADPMNIVAFFHETLTGVSDLDRDSFHRIEFAFAKELVDKHAAEGARAFITWAIGHAAKIKYRVRRLDGLRSLVNEWLAVQAQATQAHAKREQVSREYERRMQLDDYDAWRQRQVDEAIQALPANEREALTAQILAELNPFASEPERLIQRSVESRLAKLVRDRLQLPTLEHWRASGSR